MSYSGIILILVLVALIFDATVKHIQDRAHGRVPGTGKYDTPEQARDRRKYEEWVRFGRK